MPAEVRPEFKHIEKYNIVSVSGEWAFNGSFMWVEFHYYECMYDKSIGAGT